MSSKRAGNGEFYNYFVAEDSDFDLWYLNVPIIEYEAKPTLSLELAFSESNVRDMGYPDPEMGEQYYPTLDSPTFDVEAGSDKYEAARSRTHEYAGLGTCRDFKNSLYDTTLPCEYDTNA
jgi:hypothetical protein